jgi:tryptophan halogenase
MCPRKVLIVGDGASAWIAAAYLNAALRNNGRRPVEISVLESSAPVRGNHDESTLPSIRQILAVIGIDEIDLLRRVGGTFKLATRFSNWLRGTGDFYYHTFDNVRAQPIDYAARRWLNSDRSIAFAETTSPQPIICDLGLAPKPLNDESGGANLAYAYHLDAMRLADLLREVAMSRGVDRIVDDVAGIDVSSDGNIVSVQTKSGTRLQADLFVDCGGLQPLPAEKRPGEWVDCSQWLPCDRAVAMSIDYELCYPGKVRPFTTATAVSAGWIREIPLQNRRTISYFYASRFIDAADASRELRAFEGEHAQSLPTHNSSILAGHRRQFWTRNCVSIGKAASSIEPLGSTELYLCELGASMLAEHFPFGDDFEPQAFRYNRIMSNRFYEILDVVNLHYSLSQRQDTEFWRHACKPESINTRLRAKLEFWKLKIPSKADFVDQRFPGQPDTAPPTGDGARDQRLPVDTAALFGLESYEAILYGMQFLADECDQWFGPRRPPTHVPNYIIQDLKRAAQILPPHAEFLQRLAGMREYPATP